MGLGSRGRQTRATEPLKAHRGWLCGSGSGPVAVKLAPGPWLVQVPSAAARLRNHPVRASTSPTAQHEIKHEIGEGLFDCLRVRPLSQLRTTKGAARTSFGFPSGSSLSNATRNPEGPLGVRTSERRVTLLVKRRLERQPCHELTSYLTTSLDVATLRTSNGSRVRRQWGRPHI
jgi:hypothetical protein